MLDYRKDRIYSVMKAMRVVQLIGSGLSLYAAQLALAISSKANSNLVMLMADPQVGLSAGSQERLYRELLSPWVQVNMIDASRTRNPRTLVDIFKATRFFYSVHPDIIHLHNTADARIWLMLSTLLRSVPVVYTVHDVTSHLGEELRYVYRSIRNRLWQRSSALIVHGKVLREGLLVRMPDLSGRVNIIPHGPYTLYLRWKSTDAVEQPHTILFFGRIQPYKGLEILMRAIPLITRQVPDVRVIIAGKADDFSPYARLIEDPSRYELHIQTAPTEKVASLFQRASIVVLPYLEASQSGVAALACAFGKPVVATRVGSIEEMVEHGKDGALVEPNNVNQLADAIIHLLQNEDLRKTMGKHFLEKGERELSWERIAEQTLAVYERVLT